jgi:hypothetical protein
LENVEGRTFNNFICREFCWLISIRVEYHAFIPILEIVNIINASAGVVALKMSQQRG